MPSQAAGEEQSQQCAVTLASYLPVVFGLVLRLASYRGAHEFLYPFDAADSSCQIGTEQTAVGRLVGKAPHRTQA